MASRRGYSAFLIAASLLMLSGLSVLYLETDGSDGINEGFTWERNGDDVTVTGHGTLGYDSSWNGLKTLTLVPEGGTIDIDSHAFEYCNSLTTVTFNGPVGSIGDYVFHSCGSLTTVTIDGSVGSIGISSFQDCGSLSELTIAGPITPPIGEDAFMGCDNLKTVNIACNDELGITKGSTDNGHIAQWADTVNKVHRFSATYDWADDGSSCTVHIVCANTSDHNHDENATVTSTVKVQPTAIVPGTTSYSVSGTYYGFAYSDTKDIQDIPPVTEGTQGDFRWTMDGTSLTVTGHGTLGFDPLWVGLTSLTLIPDGETVNIGDGALGYCGSLTTVTINGSVGSIGIGAFYYSGSLRTVTINGSVGSIGDDALENCDSLTTVSVNGSVGSIGDYAFYDSESLTTVAIDGPVGSIGDYVFHGCGSLSELTIAGPITPSIGEHAFISCDNLRTVNIACNDSLGITANSPDNGYIAYYADTVNHVHRYSASYDWADDGSSCTVHIVCANTSDHNHDVTDATITSTVKVPPTETEKGTTEYTVSGTYDGYAFSGTKDIQDIPATGGDSDGKGINILIYVAIVAIAVLAVAGGAFLFIRSRR